MGPIYRLAFIVLVAVTFFNCSLIVDGNGNGQSDGGDTGPPLVESIATETTCTNIGAEVVFSVVASGAPIETYDWDFGDGTGADVAEPVHVYEANGTYQVRVTVTNSEGSDTFAMPTPMRAIRPGWTPFLPSTGLGDLVELWQNPANANQALALGEYGRLWGWDGTAWQDRGVALNYPQTMGAYNANAVLIADKFRDDTYAVYTLGDSGLVNADPEDQLPKGVNDAYRFIYMSSASDGLMVVRPVGGQVQIWQYDGTGGGGTDYWTVVEPVGPDVQGSAFAAAGAVGSESIFVADGSTLWRWSRNEGWVGASTESGKAPSAIAARGSTQIVYGTGDGELYLANFNISTSVWLDAVQFENVLWTSEFVFKDIAVTANGQTVYAVAVDERAPPEPDLQINVRVTDLSDPAAVELVDIATLQYGGRDVKMAAYTNAQVWHGGAGGAISRWDGSAWSRMTPEPATARDLGFPGFAPSGRMFVSNVDGRPNRMLSHYRDQWREWELPQTARSFVTYAASDEDVWTIGGEPTAYHFDGEAWEPADLGIAGEIEPFGIWGSSGEDIWAAVSLDDAAAVLRYQGADWQRDTQAEELVLQYPIFSIDGSAADNVYAASYHGMLIHYDGMAWAPVEHGLFVEPGYVNVCLDNTDNMSACQGLSGKKFAMFVSVAETGAVFASIKDTDYEWLAVASEGDYGCALGQYVCVPKLTADMMGEVPVYFNGTSWVTQTLPEIPDSTNLGIAGMWAASDTRAYATLMYRNTVTSKYEMRLVTWDGASWTLLAEQPPLPAEKPGGALHGFQAGEIYVQLSNAGQIYRYQGCEE